MIPSRMDYCVHMIIQKLRRVYNQQITKREYVWREYI